MKRTLKGMPWMSLTVDGVLADTSGYSATEFGVFMKLLFVMWRNDGTLPDDDAQLARYVGLTVKQWQKMKLKLVPPLVFENGRVTYKEVTEQLAYAKHRSETNARNARRKSLKNQKPDVAIAERSKSTYTDTYTDTGEELPTKRKNVGESMYLGGGSPNADCSPGANDDPSPFDLSKPLAGVTDKAA